MKPRAAFANLLAAVNAYAITRSDDDFLAMVAARDDAAPALRELGWRPMDELPDDMQWIIGLLPRQPGGMGDDGELLRRRTTGDGKVTWSTEYGQVAAPEAWMPIPTRADGGRI